MPISRKKSCLQCRAGKTRCSLSEPCSRCAERGLQCNFAGARGIHHQSSARGLAPIRRARGSSTQTEALASSGANAGPESAESFSGFVPLSGSSEAMHEFASLDSNSNPTSQPTDMTGISWAGAEVALDPFPEAVQTPVIRFSNLSSPAQRLFSLPGTSGAAEPSLIPSIVTAGPGASSTDPEEPALQDDPETTSGQSQMQLELTGRRYQLRLLSQRISTTTEAFLTAKVLISQMLVYPRIMVSGRRLPPFIHPPCATTGAFVHDCTPEAATHRCLPEALAICTSLLQMFYARTAGSAAFVWEQIYAHQRRLYLEHRGYDSRRLLEALQTVTMYLLLQAQDTASIDSNDVISLIVTTGEIAKSLHANCDSGPRATARFFRDRREWIMAESTRRTNSVLYGIELLLDVSLRPPGTSGCPGYANLPLPCPRELWEPVPDGEWARRYREDLAARGAQWRRTLKIGDLITSRRTHSGGECGAVVGDVAAWCEKADEFGTLLWMATMMERIM